MSCSVTLKQQGYRLTPQRRLILEILHSENSHLTADHIYERIKNQLNGVNISTVYRTLDLLESLGLVIRTEYENGHIYHHAEESHHHHLVCQKCGRIQECSETILAPLRIKLVREYGFEADLSHHVFAGICSLCREAVS